MWPLVLAFAYTVNNFEYIRHHLYFPLKHTMAPAIGARATIISLMDKNDTDHKLLDFAAELLEDEIAKVIGDAGDVGTSFQMLILALFAEGSPNVIAYFIYCLITFNAGLSLFKWANKQVKVVVNFVASGMKKNFDWNELKESVLETVPDWSFYLTNYITTNYWVPSTTNIFDLSDDENGVVQIFVATFMLISLFLLCLSFFCGADMTNARKLRISSGIIFVAPILLALTSRIGFSVILYMIVTVAVQGWDAWRDSLTLFSFWTLMFNWFGKDEVQENEKIKNKIKMRGSAKKVAHRLKSKLTGKFRNAETAKNKFN